MNAPMVPAEVLRELAPFVNLAQGLGRAAVQLVAETGFSDVAVTYHRCACLRASSFSAAHNKTCVMTI